MKRLVMFSRRVMHEDRGQDMVEYVLIFALVSIIAVVAVTTAGVSINNFWIAISAKIAALA